MFSSLFEAAKSVNSGAKICIWVSVFPNSVILSPVLYYDSCGHHTTELHHVLLCFKVKDTLDSLFIISFSVLICFFFSVILSLWVVKPFLTKTLFQCKLDKNYMDPIMVITSLGICV